MKNTADDIIHHIRAYRGFFHSDFIRDAHSAICASMCASLIDKTNVEETMKCTNVVSDIITVFLIKKHHC